RTILIAEDEAMIAIELESHLRDLGYEVVLAPTIEAAMQAIETGGIDFCVLDYDLDGNPCTTIAEALHARGIPFLICSGAPATLLEHAFEGVPIITKPFTEEFLDGIVGRFLAAPALH